jgi:hypothetical protein
MSGRRSRRKGAGAELEILHIGQDNGFAVTKRSRMYRAGQDLDWRLLGIDRCIAAVVCSLELQHGVPLDTIRRALMRDARGHASGPLATALDKLAGRKGRQV